MSVDRLVPVKQRMVRKRGDSGEQRPWRCAESRIDGLVWEETRNGVSHWKVNREERGDLWTEALKMRLIEG